MSRDDLMRGQLPVCRGRRLRKCRLTDLSSYLSIHVHVRSTRGWIIQRGSISLDILQQVPQGIESQD